jgi:hypothetical protein
MLTVEEHSQIMQHNPPNKWPLPTSMHNPLNKWLLQTSMHNLQLHNRHTFHLWPNQTLLEITTTAC